MSTSAISALTAGFEEPFRALGRDASADRDAVVISWPSVPVELVRGAGFRAIVAQGSAAPTPAADELVEPDVFPSRLRQLVEAALTGRLAHVAAIVLPRTSDPDYKCFLYLREIVRRGRVASLPPVLLFDLLQSEGPDVRRYDADRTRELVQALAQISGRPSATDDLRAAVRAANAARAAARRVEALRRGAPKLKGLEALPLLGAFWQLPPERYAALAGSAAESIALRPALEGPRVLLAGAPVDSPALHAALESEGAMVVAELSPFGSGAAGRDLDTAADPIVAIADHYRTEAIDARTPLAAIERRIEDALPGVDLVVVSLPPDDATFGWDYPALRSTLDGRSLPHVVLRGDPAGPLPAADRAKIAALLADAARREVRHGG